MKIRSWLHRPVKHWLNQLLVLLTDRIREPIMSAILDSANKISADIDAKLIDSAAKDAKIADLTAQVAALTADQADTLTAIDVLTAADNKLNPLVG